MFSLFRKKMQTESPSTIVDDGVVRVTPQSLIALHRGAESLSLKPKRIRAQQSGNYLSPFKGRGMEFDESRPYIAGDDVRTLDWRVTARSGKPHTKLFREERERVVLLWCDLRPSMFFATRGAYKAVRAAQTAALLGWSALHHGDRIGALIFNETQHVELRPKRGKHALLHLFNRLGDGELWRRAPQPEAPQPLNGSLLRLRRVAQPGSLIFLASDFDQLDELGRSHLAHLARHCDLVLIPIHDPLEAELPLPGRYRVSNGERIVAIDTSFDKVRDDYRQRYQWQQAELQQFCRRHNIYLLPMGTADDPLHVLQRGLAGRT